MKILGLNSLVKYNRHECSVRAISKEGVLLICDTKKRKCSYLVSLKDAEDLEVLEV
jgi:hypothetical protein